MKDFPPNLDPKVYNASAILIGLALIGNFNVDEQNAIGNWFMTIGQVLENNAAWQCLIEGRLQGDNVNINSRKFKKTGDPFTDAKPWVESPQDKEINNLKKIIKIMKKEIEELKKKNY